MFLRKHIPAVILAAIAALSLSAFAQSPAVTAPSKPRVVITADPELDDLNTLVRAILYSTDFDLEGLVYTSSRFHWKGDGKGTTQFIPGREYVQQRLGPVTSWRWTEENFIDEVVDAYAHVYRNLKVHNQNYPSPAELKAKIKWGNVEFEGDYSKDTDGSNLIKALLLDDKPGPLFVTAQGGQSTIARALKSIYDHYSQTPQWNAIRGKVSRKLVIIPWGDQDFTYARYIRPNWPEVVNWQLAMLDYGYRLRAKTAPENLVYLSGQWTRENVSDRGPLGALYRVWGDGKLMSEGDRGDYFGLSGYSSEQLKTMGYVVWMPPQEKGSFISEGDTPTFLNLLDNGLRAYENGFWGGWAGRRKPDSDIGNAGTGTSHPAGPDSPVAPDDPGLGLGLRSADGRQVSAPAGSGGGVSGMATLIGQMPPSASNDAASSRRAAVNAAFFAAAQRDFAARLKWSVTPQFRDANHEPIVSLIGPMESKARAGETVCLSGDVRDPDQNQVSARWWQYNDAGTYPGDITISDPASLNTRFRIPADAKSGQTIHVILEATDNGTPSLTRYQRLVVVITE